MYDKYASWAVLVLPYLEQGPLFRQWDLALPYLSQPAATVATPVPVYFCPSRRQPPSLTTGTQDGALKGSAGDYAGCGGTRAGYGAELDGWDSANPASPTPANGAIITARGGTVTGGQLQKWKGQVPLAAIRDGTSNTLLFGEKHVPRATLNADIGDASAYNGDHHRTIDRVAGAATSSSAAGGPWVYDLGRGPTDVGGGAERYQRIFGSWHPAACNFALADGSVRTLAVATDTAVLERLADRADGKPVTVP